MAFERQCAVMAFTLHASTSLSDICMNVSTKTPVIDLRVKGSRLSSTEASSLAHTAVSAAAATAPPAQYNTASII
jgi:hypothetical protein